MNNEEGCEPGSELRQQDEILQVMYWMKGEGLGREVSAVELARFLPLTNDAIERTLEQMVMSGLLDCAAGERRYRLTPIGDTEAARRFAEEFTPYLGKESHIVCDDPNCDCHAEDFTGVCKNAVH